MVLPWKKKLWINEIVEMDTLSIAELTEDERVSLKLLTIIDPGDRISNFIDLAEITFAAHIYSCLLQSLSILVFYDSSTKPVSYYCHVYPLLDKNKNSKNSIYMYVVKQYRSLFRGNAEIFNKKQFTYINRYFTYEIIILNPNQRLILIEEIIWHLKPT